MEIASQTFRPVAAMAAAALVAEIARQPSLHGTADLAAEIAIIRRGGTILNIVAGLHIATGRPLTGLAVQREATRSLIVSLVQDNSLVDRAALLLAIGRVTEASETEQVVDRPQAADPVEEGQTALEGGTSHEVVAEIETHSEVVPGVLVDTTDLAHVPTAAAGPPAWVREAAASEAAVGADNRHQLRNCREHGNEAKP